MLRRIAAAARALRNYFARPDRHRPLNARRPADALRDATSAICDRLEERRLLSVTFDTIDAQYIA